MPTTLSQKDVISGFLPSKTQRYAPVSGSSVTQDASVAVPESAYQTTFIKQANGMFGAINNYQSSMASRDLIVRGVQEKNQTFATLDALPGNANSSTNPANKFADFILQDVQEADEEKAQIVETFGDPIVLFYGSRPKIYRYSGVLLNTLDYAWRDGWRAEYADSLRGTQLAKNKRRAYLTYDFVLREGYLLSMNIGQISAHPNHVDFSFTMYITREVNLDASARTKMKDESNERSSSKQSAFNAMFNSPVSKAIATYKDRIQEGIYGAVSGSSATAKAMTAFRKGVGVDGAALR